jgi:hypothetical protein
MDNFVSAWGRKKTVLDYITVADTGRTETVDCRFLCLNLLGINCITM